MSIAPISTSTEIVRLSIAASMLVFGGNLTAEAPDPTGDRPFTARQEVDAISYLKDHAATEIGCLYMGANVREWTVKMVTVLEKLLPQAFYYGRIRVELLCDKTFCRIVAQTVVFCAKAGDPRSCEPEYAAKWETEKAKYCALESYDEIYERLQEQFAFPLVSRGLSEDFCFEDTFSYRKYVDVVFKGDGITRHALVNRDRPSCVISEDTVKEIGGMIARFGKDSETEFNVFTNSEGRLGVRYTGLCSDAAYIPKRLSRLTFHIEQMTYAWNFIVVPWPDVLVLGQKFLETYGISGDIPREMAMPNTAKLREAEQVMVDRHRQHALINDHPPLSTPRDYRFPDSVQLSQLWPGKPIKQTKKSKAQINQQVTSLLKRGYIYQVRPTKHFSFPRYNSNMDDWLMIDYTNLNKMTPPLSVVAENNFLRAAKEVSGMVFSTIDLCEAYYSLGLYSESQPLTTFKAPNGNFYSFKVLSPALSNAQKYLHVRVSQALDRSREFTRSYMDSILVFSNSIEEHYTHLGDVITYLTGESFRLNTENCHFFQSEVTWLGHVISSKDGVTCFKPQSSLLEAIRKCRRPESKKEIQSLMGRVSLIADFMEDYADTVSPLLDMLGGNAQFQWTKRCRRSFHKLTNLNSDSLTLYPFVRSRGLTITASSSEVGVDVCLWQLTHSKWVPVQHGSHRYSPSERRWPTEDKQMYSVYFAVDKYKRLLSARKKILVYTAHKNVPDIFFQDRVTERQLKWIKELSHCSVEIEYRERGDIQPGL